MNFECAQRKKEERDERDGTSLEYGKFQKEKFTGKGKTGGPLSQEGGWGTQDIIEN